jgi:23S rRNA maturation-related 3'-5' exoribonuclease YhaM
MQTPKYFSIEELINKIDEPNRSACIKILVENRKLFETIPGSTHNHQTFFGGYFSHVLDGMNYAYYLYDFDASFGRPLPFSKSDALLIFFLHDLEKPWRIEVMEDGTVRNRPGLDTKEAFKAFRENKLAEYGINLTPAQLNGLTYVEGEIKDYSSLRRVMNELAAFCHKVDVMSARVWYDYPKLAGEDEWIGADRIKDNK